MNFKVSVIIPVYNVSKYLRQCLDSIVNQSLQEIEIIIINDASPDPQDEIICLEYKEKDNRIKYIKHSSNKGSGGARNTGILSSSAPYLTFVDSDDFIHKDLCKDFYEAAIEKDYDLVHGRFINYYYGVSKKIISPPASPFLIKDEPEKVFTQHSDLFAWSKLFKRDFLLSNSIFFTEYFYFEDEPFTLEVELLANSKVCLDKAYYFYRHNNNESITKQTINKKHVESKFFCIDRNNEILDYYNADDRLRKIFNTKRYYIFFNIAEADDKTFDVCLEGISKRDYLSFGGFLSTLDIKKQRKAFAYIYSMIIGRKRYLISFFFKRLGIFNLAKKLYWIIKPIILKFKGSRIN